MREQYQLLGLALAFYTASLIFSIWRLAMGQPYRRWPKLVLVLPGFALHTGALLARGLAEGRCPVSNLFETLTFVAWCLVALHLTVVFLMKMQYLTPFSMPVVLVIQMAAFLTPVNPPRPEPFGTRLLVGMHASVIMLGYAAFGLAAVVGLMYLVQERQLRTRRLSSQFMLLPPILRLETLQKWLLLGGFALLTFGLASGFIGLSGFRESLFQADWKVLWSIAVWSLYLILVVGRNRWGLTGRRMAWLSIAGCLFVIGTFWLSNHLSHFHQY